VRPAYPPIARAARVQGVVIVALTVGADGRVESTTIERDIPLLSRGAVEAAKDSGFICRDCTGPMTYRLKYDFRLADSIEEVEAARAAVTSTSGTLPVVFWTPAVTIHTAGGPRPTSGRPLEHAEQEP
jgi:TonB family protein